MKQTLFLSVFDGDTERVILKTDVFKVIKEEGGFDEIILLVRGKDRIEYYRSIYEDERVTVELLPPAGSKLEALWYYISWNSIPTRAVAARRKREFAKDKRLLRYIVFCGIGLLARVPAWRSVLRLIYRYTGEDYAQELFTKYKPSLLFAPNMFSLEDLRLLRMAEKLGIPSVSTAKSWDVLVTKAFTRVLADRLLVFNEYNNREAVRYGDYRPEQVVTTGFPQFDGYVRRTGIVPREVFLQKLGIAQDHRYLLYGVPGDWKSPFTKDILAALDEAIELGKLGKIKVLARLHPKYPDSSEGTDFKHILMERPGMYFNEKRGFAIDSGTSDQYPWAFRQDDIDHLANEIHHADAVIVTDSTLALDAAASGKPAIIIGYDGGNKLPYWKSIASTYERDHYRNLLALGATPLVTSHDELVNTIAKFLKDPGYLSEARSELIRKFLFKNDGKSGERMGRAVLECAPKDPQVP